MTLRTLLVSTWLIAACSGGAGPADDDARHSVLFIGNSLTYANDLPGILAALIQAGGDGTPLVESVAYPNYGLQDHWESGDALAAVRAGGWDVVVLQQGPSASEGRPSLLEYSALFDAEIRRVGARTALYMVWPGASRSFDFDGVSASYAMAADAVGGLLFPVGEAWREAWRRDADLALYGGDGFHPSEAGSYLAAAVMYGQLTGRTPVGLPATVRTASDARIDLPAAVARILQESAEAANARFADRQ